jgi:vitamin B12 transporter
VSKPLYIVHCSSYIKTSPPTLPLAYAPGRLGLVSEARRPARDSLPLGPHGGCATNRPNIRPVRRRGHHFRYVVLLARWIACWLWLGTWGIAVAQDTASVRVLNTVMVRGFAPERFMAGLKVQCADSVLTMAYSYQTLADLLALQAPMQFKSYGPGQLTTVGLRGTSANHMAVLWNGININPPSLGQTDFSTLPVAGFDQVSIQYGAAASVVGSDAVGGSVLLNSAPHWQRQGIVGTLGHRFGAWGSYQTQAELRFTKQQADGRQLAGKTLFYSGKTRFAPTYRERQGYPVELSETPQRGVVQDIFYRTKQANLLSINVWLTDNTLTLSPADSVGRETTRTQAYRFLATYAFGQARPGRWFSGNTMLRAGFIRDITDYGKGRTYDTNPSHTETDRLLFRAEHELSPPIGTSARPLTVRLGTETGHYTARVDGYVGNALTEQRADFYVLTRYQPTNRLALALNLRQALVTGYNPPFTPSVGLEYRFWQRPGWQLTGRANMARAYRVPTLNERYWKTLGNPGIRPERGFSQDVGLALTRQTGRTRASLDLSAFSNHVQDWTYWNPDRGYRVENLQEVLARGLEAQGQLAQANGNWQWGGFGQYALTRSSQQRVYDPSALDVVGKQLIYIPVHTGSLTAYIQRGSHRLTLTAQLMGERPYTFDNSRYLPAYQLLGLLLQTRIKLGGWQGQAIAQVDNLFDTLYLNVKRNAMPGRTVALTLVLTAHSKHTP